jgi:hypothetical protein
MKLRLGKGDFLLRIVHLIAFQVIEQLRAFFQVGLRFGFIRIITISFQFRENLAKEILHEDRASKFYRLFAGLEECETWSRQRR